ncbi:MAG TPA: peptide ABC transporter permease, partial [bacterium]|nr:peptide ABC transporter permease [bacterium]
MGEAVAQAAGGVGAASARDAGGQSYGQAAWRRFRRHRLALVGGGLAALLSLAALLAPWLAPYAADRLALGTRWAPPGPGHWLGTDELGRDVLSRLMHAGRVSLLVGYVVAVNVAVIGMVVGAVAGFYGGVVD